MWVCVRACACACVRACVAHGLARTHMCHRRTRARTHARSKTGRHFEMRTRHGKQVCGNEGYEDGEGKGEVSERWVVRPRTLDTFRHRTTHARPHARACHIDTHTQSHTHTHTCRCIHAHAHTHTHTSTLADMSRCDRYIQTCKAHTRCSATRTSLRMVTTTRLRTMPPGMRVE